MQNRDIIVVGASAGGVEALRALASRLPPDLPASVFVVLHLSAGMPSELASVLSRSGPLPAHEAITGQMFEPGRIYVAPPDRHLILENSHMRLWRGPKENRHRPAINVLFRSAAVAYGPRVIGIVLSGILDDGTTGLWWIKRHGGVAIVQDPADAIFPDMIYSALEHVQVDHIVTMEGIGGLLANIVDRRGNQSLHPARANQAEEAGRKWRPSEQ